MQIKRQVSPQTGLSVRYKDASAFRRVEYSLDYLFIHRPILNRELKLTINNLRVLNELPELSEEQALAIDLCPFVFRPNKQIAFKRSLKSLLAFNGAEQCPPDRLSHAVYRNTRQYIPDCSGFSANACRHLVSTEYIRNHPDGEAVAAAALHNTIWMVRKHYAWVTPADRIKPWNNYYEELHRKFEAGEL